MTNIASDSGDAFALTVDQTQLKGFLSKHGVANFLNVPYARVPVRFRTAQPVAISGLPKSLDVSQYGPRCPQKPNPVAQSMSHVFENVSLSQEPDEMNCLHLNIYCPLSALESTATSKLPVFAWIHGGAFNAGDNTSQFDGNHLIRRSVQLGKPVIIVAINYRLNVLGFSSSRELIEEARSLGETPIANQGLHDQRIALQWIHSSIHHFGGDPSRVTLAGESAGAASVLCHLKGDVPLFHQALIQSPPAPRLRTADEAQAAFDKLIESAGISADLAGSQKLAALRNLTSEQLVDLFDGSVSFPAEDKHWFAGYDHEQDLTEFWGSIPAWCRATILGNTKDEAALLLAFSNEVPVKETVEFTRAIVPDVSVPESISQQKCTRGELVAWSTEESFLKPLVKVASVASKHGARVYVYRITCVDPFPGPLQGYAWHSFGIPLTFYQPPCRVYPELEAAQDNMSSAFLDFFYGLEPWQDFSQARQMLQWGGESTSMVSIDKSAVEKTETMMEPKPVHWLAEPVDEKNLTAAIGPGLTSLERPSERAATRA